MEKKETNTSRRVELYSVPLRLQTRWRGQVQPQSLYRVCTSFAREGRSSWASAKDRSNLCSRRIGVEFEIAQKEAPYSPI